MKKQTIISILLVISSLIIYKSCKIIESNKNKDKTAVIQINSLQYKVSSDYILQTREIFNSEIDKSNSNYSKDPSIDNTKQIVQETDSKLYIRKDNVDEQVVIFDLPIAEFKKKSDINYYFNGLEEYLESDALSLDFHILDKGNFYYNKKYNVSYLYTMVGFPDGDKRYSFYYIIEFDNKFYQVIMNSYDKDNNLYKVLELL